jgi:recombination protein RecA
LHGGGFGSHPRSEVKGLSEAVGRMLRPEAIAPQCAEPQSRVRPQENSFHTSYQRSSTSLRRPITSKPWPRIEQALRTADLLLQTGGFSAIVLDMASLAPEHVSRVPLATWHRYRLASERTQSSILLLTRHACAKSSAELLLRLQPSDALRDEDTVFTGTMSELEVVRQRFTQTANNVVTLRKPPQSLNGTSWQCRTPWASQR